MPFKWKIIASLMLCLCFNSIAFSEETTSPVNADNPAIEQKALDLIDDMSSYLSGAKTLTFAVDTMVDASVKGQLLNFFTNNVVTVKKPNKLKVITKSDSKPNEFYFDGKTMITYSPKDNLYAVVDAPATLDELFPFAMEKAGVHTTFSDILTSDPYSYLTASLVSAFWAGQSHIDGILCDHIALKEEGMEYQIWIAGDDKPLPIIMTITYTALPEKPRFILHYSNWKVDVPVAQHAFIFKKPAGASKIDYQPIMATDIGGGNKK